MTRRRRLIEVAFPLEEVSAHSRREKNIRHGHISTLHIWWARRPLAACRAFIYASLVDDPETDQEREELLKEVADLASWDAVRHPDQVVRPRAQGGSGLTGTKLLESARQRILDCNGGQPPRLLDPFAGGGAIPLEALRLGCAVEASDLNPVAVLILKGTVEYPQKYGRPLAEQMAQLTRGDRDSVAGVDGIVPAYIRDSARQTQSSFAEGDAVAAYEKNPLAADVRYWGNWILERAREELAEFYPPDPDGSIPVAYLWSRTIPCPNCQAEMPLIRQYWLARKDKKKVALKPVLNRENSRVDFEVVEGPDVTGDPAEATTSRGDTVCLLCRQVVKAETVRQTAQAGRLGAILTAVILEPSGSGGKCYRADLPPDSQCFDAATSHLKDMRENHEEALSVTPNEPIAPSTLGLRVDNFGLDTWDKLFNDRQLTSLATFVKLVNNCYTTMLNNGFNDIYATGVVTYLAIAVDRLADRSSQLCRWDNTGESMMNTFARQALSMIADFAEVNPLSDSTGGFKGSLEWIDGVLSFDNSYPSYARVNIERRDATGLIQDRFNAIITDPPYYNSIDYAGLSDFFYVWLKRALFASSHNTLFNLPLTPKKEQAIMASETENREARHRYVELMTSAFHAMRPSVVANGLVNVVFAHTDPDAWSTLIESILSAGLVPSASWPIDTELTNKVSADSRANLKTSVWMACRPRELDAADAFLGDVMEEMRPIIRDRLLDFWARGIRGADFFISAIGPALSVFGRHSKVMRPDGSDVSVREFLDLVRRESTQVALEQVLGGADLGQVDSITRQYVTWVWSYSRAPLDTGEAIALCLATGADYRLIVRPGSIAVEAKEKSKKVAKLRTIKERGRDEEDLGLDTSARPAALIDQLQRAANLWGLNRTEELAIYRGILGETRWAVLRTLGQAVAECLPAGDEDRRLILGLLGSNVMAVAPKNGAGRPVKSPPEGVQLTFGEDQE